MAVLLVGIVALSLMVGKEPEYPPGATPVSLIKRNRYPRSAGMPVLDGVESVVQIGSIPHPREKIIIDGNDLSAFASEELETSVTVSTLLRAVSAYKNEASDKKDQAVIDAATALCHQVADRVWGECRNREDDEWQEIDISTTWRSGADEGADEGAEELAVVVRRM